LAVTPDGSHVGLFWYDRRLDPADWLIDRFGAIGTVSGHTVAFGANFRISDVSFPPAYGQDPIVFPNYMGDYDQATADNSYFYTTWGDNRLSDAFFANQPDVRFAKIPVTWGDSATAAATQSLAPTTLLDPTLLLPSTVSAMPAVPTTGALVWTARSARESIPATVSSHVRVTDVIFAAAGGARTDESSLDGVSLGAL
jgi:hypothetical protein